MTEHEGKTVIALETSPAELSPAWVTFLKQRLDVLHIDYRHIGPGRVVVVAMPGAAESVVHLVHSAMECADRYVRTALRNVAAHGKQHE